MLRTFLSVIAAALLISVILLTPASSADTGEAIIPSNGHRSWSVEMDRPFTLSYTIETVGDSRVNVLVIPSENYSGYLEGSGFNSMADVRASNVTNATADVRLGAGLYYVVVEAAGGSSDGTAINYRIDALATQSQASSLQIVLGAGALVLLGIVLLFFLDMRMRKKR
jgi:hypothetical protein